MKTTKTVVLSALGSALICGAAGAQGVTAAQADAVMKASFKDRGQAKVDRLVQDETQALCSKYTSKLPKDIGKKIEAANMKLVKYPADGKLVGD